MKGLFAHFVAVLSFVNFQMLAKFALGLLLYESARFSNQYETIKCKKIICTRHLCVKTFNLLACLAYVLAIENLHFMLHSRPSFLWNCIRL